MRRLPPGLVVAAEIAILLIALTFVTFGHQMIMP